MRSEDKCGCGRSSICALISCLADEVPPIAAMVRSDSRPADILRALHRLDCGLTHAQAILVRTRLQELARSVEGNTVLQAAIAEIQRLLDERHRLVLAAAEKEGASG
jgi:hypothetical protein